MAGEPIEWLCTECLSLNGKRADRCYRCRTPRFAAEAIEGVREPKPITPQTSQPPPPGTPIAVKGAPPYRTARPYANAAMALIVAATAATMIHFGLAALAARATLSAPEVQRVTPPPVYDEFGDPIEVPPTPEPSPAVPSAQLTDFNASPLGILTGAITIDPNSTNVPIALSRLLQVGLVGAAIVVWAAWLARAVENVPALGGGWPSLTPAWAFFLCLIPGVNLIRPAGMVRELFERIPGPNGPGTGLVSLWWIALFVGAVLQVPRLGTAILQRAIGILLFITSGSEHDRLRIELILNGFGVVLSVIAAVLAVRVVSTMQGRLEERAASLGDGALAAAQPV
ncbi:MAG TPA: DUF4328 domain-containing protein [Candidatus Limnocylindrales bacterium]